MQPKNEVLPPKDLLLTNADILHVEDGSISKSRSLRLSGGRIVEIGTGHLGDGNVHFHVRAPAGVDAQRWFAEEAPVVTRFVDDLVVTAGGSISAEHGIGQMKLGELERLSSRARMTALRAIKAALDPHGIMNPGKLVTLARGGAGE